MAEVNGYLVLAVVLSLVFGVTMALSSSAVASETRAALGTLALFALITPVISLFSSNFNIPNIDENVPLPDYDGGYTEVVATAYEDGLGMAIADRLGIDKDDVYVSVYNVDIEKMLASRIVVRLGSEAMLSDARTLREWLREEFILSGGEVVIEYGK